MGVVLLGYRGSGKSAVGRELAQRLGTAMVDTDQQVSQRAGMTIAEIFERDGEAAFRRLESRVLAEALQDKAAVISTGGGIVLDGLNRQMLVAWPGARVYLRCDAEELARRIAADPVSSANRPKLTAAGGPQEVRELLAVREPLYREVMTAEIDVTQLSPGQVVQAIVGMI